MKTEGIYPATSQVHVQIYLGEFIDKIWFQA
jgi:hypothetical protein